jgi:hypothetical protein
MSIIRHSTATFVTGLEHLDRDKNQRSETIIQPTLNGAVNHASVASSNASVSSSVT